MPDGVFYFFFGVPFSLFLCSSVKVCTIMIEVSSKQSRSQLYMHTECCCCRCCCCCSVRCYTVAAAAVPLLPAAVRHRVPDGQICWFVESVPVFSFCSLKRDLFLMVPLGSTASHLRPRFAYILGNYGHARSQGGRQPAAGKPALY